MAFQPSMFLYGQQLATDSYWRANCSRALLQVASSGAQQQKEHQQSQLAKEGAEKEPLSSMLLFNQQQQQLFAGPQSSFSPSNLSCSSRSSYLDNESSAPEGSRAEQFCNELIKRQKQEQARHGQHGDSIGSNTLSSAESECDEDEAEFLAARTQCEPIDDDEEEDDDDDDDDEMDVPQSDDEQDQALNLSLNKNNQQNKNQTQNQNTKNICNSSDHQTPTTTNNLLLSISDKQQQDLTSALASRLASHSLLSIHDQFHQQMLVAGQPMQQQNNQRLYEHLSNALGAMASAGTHSSKHNSSTTTNSTAVTALNSNLITNQNNPASSSLSSAANSCAASSSSSSSSSSSASSTCSSYAYDNASASYSPERAQLHQAISRLQQQQHHHHQHHHQHNLSANSASQQQQQHLQHLQQHLQAQHAVAQRSADSDDLDRIRNFIEEFKQRRGALGLTQKQAAQCFRAYTNDRYAFSDNFVGHFEGFQFRPQTAMTIADSLAEWLEYAEQETRTGRQLSFMPGKVKETRKRKYEVIRIRDSAKKVLVEAFEKNRSPSTVELEQLSKKTNIPSRNIEIFFKNRRTSRQYHH